MEPQGHDVAFAEEVSEGVMAFRETAGYREVVTAFVLTRHFVHGNEAPTCYLAWEEQTRIQI